MWFDSLLLALIAQPVAPLVFPRKRKNHKILQPSNWAETGRKLWPLLKSAQGLQVCNNQGTYYANYKVNRAWFSANFAAILLIYQAPFLSSCSKLYDTYAQHFSHRAERRDERRRPEERIKAYKILNMRQQGVIKYQPIQQ